jgi:sugar/nucleoside kinase (ribokinase family)
VKFDVVCVGSPFLDLIFHELSHLPRPGEEVLAKRLTLTPGGISNVAYACHQLGLSSAICAPRGVDALGQVLERLIQESGVHWVGRTAESTPISVAIPADRDRGFITVNPDMPPDVETLATIEARAIVSNLPNIARLPRRPGMYAILGDPEAVALAEKMTDPLTHLSAFFLNEREATLLTCLNDPLAAAHVLAALGTTVVMTRGHAGAVAVTSSGDEIVVAAPALEVPDPTGAGDAFTAAYIWSDLRGDSLERRMEIAVLYASRSIGGQSSRQKGLPLDEFIALLSE